MKWMQFFKPVSSIDWAEANRLIASHPKGEVFLLDVRQPKEYESGHQPGANLIPVGELDKRLDEVPKDKPVIVYCAIGGRSRVASQMLKGKGFSKVYNLAGGIKAWKNEVAVGPEDTGMYLFEGDATAEEVIVTGFGLEVGLRDFYLSMKSKVSSDEARKLFLKLAEVEVVHQEQLVKLYTKITGNPVTIEEFQEKVVEPAMEGGLTTDEYLNRYEFDIENEVDILTLAMAIEVQALDLYLRAADNSTSGDARDSLLTIAEEERKHIEMLGKYIDQRGDLQ